MHELRLFVTSAVVTIAAVAPARADVQLIMHDGRVSLVAKDATVRQILAEWARVGQTKIVNAERITGGPVTLELTDVPEKQALDIVLRSVSGYLAAPRPTFLPNASHFDRILVLPASTPVRTVTSSAPPPLPQPRFQLPTVDPADDVPPAPTLASPRPPVTFSPIPAVPDLGRSTSPPTFAAPTAPVGTAAPGMFVQPPPTPQQQQQPPPQQGQPGRF